VTVVAFPWISIYAMPLERK